MITAQYSLLDLAWILSSSALVMLMQAGFCLLECGLARAKNSINVAIKNLVDFLIAAILYWLVGFGLMFGATWSGWIGTNHFAVESTVGPSVLAFFLFQLVFCGTSTTIISGAVAERIRFTGYVVISILVSGLIYPVFGHWAWNGSASGHLTGWLGRMGFIDFAGSTCVHSVGGWISLAACLLVGPRLGRFTAGSPPMNGHNLSLAMVGVMMLWFSWFGFNGGSTLQVNHTVPLILVNTNLAAAAGGLTALALCYLLREVQMVPMTMNGVLAGLVAITASCHIQTPATSIVTGCVAACLCYLAVRILERLHIDDVVGAFPVHAVAGVWGTLAVALLADPANFGTGLDKWSQLGVQAIGALACFVWSFGVGMAILAVVNWIVPLRVSAEAEQLGLNVSEHAADNEFLTLLDEMDGQRQRGDFSRHVSVEPHTEVGQIALQYNHVMDRVHAEIQTREQAVAALRQAEEKYRGIFENAVEGIFQTTPDGRYLSANPSLARIYGYSSVDALVNSIRDVSTQLYVDPKRRFQFAELVRQKGVVTGFVSEVFRADGKRIWISENARVIRDETGAVLYYEGTVEDVTERQVSEELEREKNAALAANEAKSLFLANMSHEIRTPLNGVIGMLDLLSRTELDVQQKRYSRIAKSSADALLGLINHILDFSKIEAGKLELEAIEFDLRLMLEDTAEMFAHRAEEKGIELVCHVAPGLPAAVYGDPERLRQIAINLLNNAVKFTEKGEVVLRAHVLEDNEHDVLVRFAVKDTGIGIPKDRMDRLFQAFSQVDESTTRKYGGTGLGLVISQQLVQLMRGEMGVESEIGSGSTFWWTARFHKCESNRARDNTIPQQLRDLRILAVDDNAANLEILREQISAWGFELATASTGPAALDLLRDAAADDEPYKLAILDRQMPGMNGLQLANLIKSSGELKETALLVLTSMDENDDSDQFKRLGVAKCLTKPIRQSRLFDAIIEAAVAKPSNGFGHRPPVAAPKSVQSSHKVNGVSPRILLAEDNQVNQFVASEILSKAGYSCDIVDNGLLAVEAVLGKPYDVVLMDCQMPELDGFCASRKIREHEREGATALGVGGRTLIIALTANAVKGDRERCIEAGMDGYVSKPIDPDALIKAVITGLIENQSAQDAAAAVEANSVEAPNVEAPRVRSNGSERNGVEKNGSHKNGRRTDPTPNRNGERPVDVVDLLRRCMADAAFAKEVLRQFEHRIVDDLATLQGLVDSRDWKVVAREAHALKGSAGNLAAGSLRRLAIDLEDTSRREDAAAACRCMDELRREMKRFLEYLPQAAAELDGVPIGAHDVN